MNPHNTHFSYRFNQERHAQHMENARKARQAEIAEMTEKHEQSSVMHTISKTVKQFIYGQVQDTTTDHNNSPIADFEPVTHRI